MGTTPTLTSSRLSLTMELVLGVDLTLSTFLTVGFRLLLITPTISLETWLRLLTPERPSTLLLLLVDTLLLHQSTLSIMLLWSTLFALHLWFILCMLLL